MAAQLTLFEDKLSVIRFTDKWIIVGANKYDRHLVEKIIDAASDPNIKNIVAPDGFAGMGGVTHGFHMVPGWMVIACINHWETAINNHRLNHPNCLHLQEDFTTADLTIIWYMIREIKKRNPEVTVHIWLSLECTNFSNAKGGMSRDADSRTLADHADRYLEELNPDVLWIENVKEFMLWGPLVPKVVGLKEGKKSKVFVPKGADSDTYYSSLITDGVVLFCPLAKKGKGKDKRYEQWSIPDPNHKGQDFDAWVDLIKSYGYDYDKRLLNAADYGVPQHRVRLIIQFNRKGIPASWPEPTHDKRGNNGLPRWEPVKGVLDLEDEGPTVLKYKVNKNGQLVPRIKSAKTVDRLIKGIVKHALKGENQHITKFLSNSPKDGLNSGVSVNDTAPTTNTQGRHYLTTSQFLSLYYSEGQTDKSIDETANAVPTKDRAFLTTSVHLDKQFGGNEHNHQSIQMPAGACTQNPKYNLVHSLFVDHQFSSGQQNKSIEETSGALQSNPKQKLVQVDQYVMNTQFDNVGHGLDRPAGTQTANRKHFYLISTHWSVDDTKGLDEPAAAVIARMDKAPQHLIVTEFGELAIEVYDYEPPHMVKLKRFMAENSIVDIKMRQLNKRELKRIQTLPESTILSGSDTDIKKMIGNAVPSKMVAALGYGYDKGRSYKQQIA